jgi:RNA polymerase sigma factor (TIGR02999 family)
VLSTKQFELLLPWYLNGTLSDDESVSVAGYLQAHPEEAIRVRWNAALRGAMGGLADELPHDLGLERALSAVRPGQVTRLPQAMHAGDAGIEERVLVGPQERKLPASRRGEITQLLVRVNDGDRAARDALFALAYGELKKLAHVRLYQGGRGDVLDTTVLVHEAYIRFIQSGELRSEDRRSFFAFASQVMRNVIVDTVRARLAQRRGGGAVELTLSTQLLDQMSSGEEDILGIHEALLVLEQVEPRLARLVEMRYFGGYSEAEIAETLGVTERTVQRDWNKARLLLKATLEGKC